MKVLIYIFFHFQSNLLSNNLALKINGIKLLIRNIDFLLNDQFIFSSVYQFKNKLTEELKPYYNINYNKSSITVLEKNFDNIKNRVLDDCYSFFINEFTFDQNEYKDILNELKKNIYYLEDLQNYRNRLYLILDLIEKEKFPDLLQELEILNQKNEFLLKEIINNLEDAELFKKNASFYFFLLNFKNLPEENVIFLEILYTFSENIKSTEFIQRMLTEIDLSQIIIKIFISADPNVVNYNNNQLNYDNFILKALNFYNVLNFLRSSYLIIYNFINSIISKKKNYNDYKTDFNFFFTNFIDFYIRNASYIFKLYYTITKYNKLILLFKKKIKKAINNIKVLHYPAKYIISISRDTKNMLKILNSDEFKKILISYYKNNKEKKINLYINNFIKKISEMIIIIRVFFNSKYNFSIDIKKLTKLIDNYFLCGQITDNTYFKNFLYNFYNEILNLYKIEYCEYISSLPYENTLENKAFFTSIKSCSLKYCLELKMKMKKKIFNEINKDDILIHNRLNFKMCYLAAIIKTYPYFTYHQNIEMSKISEDLIFIYKFNQFLLKIH